MQKTPSAGARGGAPAPTATRGGTLCIGLLVVAILLQLYVISLWLAPAPPANSMQQTIALAAACAQHSRTTHLGRTVSLIQKGEENSLTDANQAITALHLLQKFIRENAGKLDRGTEQQLELAAPTMAQAAASTPATPTAAGVMAVADDKRILDHEISVPAGEGSVAAVDAKKKEKHDQHKHKGGKKHAGHEHHASDTHTEEYLTSRPNLYKDIWLGISATWAEDTLSPQHYHKLPEDQKKRYDKCDEYQKIGHVVPDESWGNLPRHFHGPFDELLCSDVVSLKETANYIKQNPQLYDHVWAVPEDRQRVKAEPGFENKVIAIIVAMTTRTITINNFETDLALFKDLFPSFTRTLDPGFEYWFYLGYDRGDPWLDNEEHLEQTRRYFEKNVAGELKKRDIVCKLVISTWENPFRRPGPAFNHVTGVAYADGATWLYRINDDQYFESPWAAEMVKALEEMGYPYGVVGPACGQGATHILVVDFVHRTHHQIFPTHYPPSLQAWWMDNWVRSRGRASEWR